MKTPLFVLVFSLVLSLPSFAGTPAAHCVSDSLKKAADKELLSSNDTDLTVDEKILFQEKVFIHIYDQQNEPLISGEFSRKELSENNKLKALLRKSTRFLNIDQHHYYFVNEG